MYLHSKSHNSSILPKLYISLRLKYYKNILNAQAHGMNFVWLSLSWQKSTLLKSNWQFCYNLKKLKFCICFAHENMKKLPWNLGYFSKISEVFSTALTAQKQHKYNIYLPQRIYKPITITRIFPHWPMGFTL